MDWNYSTIESDPDIFPLLQSGWNTKRTKSGVSIVLCAAIMSTQHYWPLKLAELNWKLISVLATKMSYILAFKSIRFAYAFTPIYWFALKRQPNEWRTFNKVKWSVDKCKSHTNEFYNFLPISLANHFICSSASLNYIRNRDCSMFQGLVVIVCDSTWKCRNCTRRNGFEYIYKIRIVFFQLYEQNW